MATPTFTPVTETVMVKPDGSVDLDTVQTLPIAWNVVDNPFAANIDVTTTADSRPDIVNPYSVDNRRRFRPTVSLYQKSYPNGLTTMGGTPPLEERSDGANLEFYRGDTVIPQLSDVGADPGLGLPTQVVMSIGDGGYIDPMNPLTRILANKNLANVRLLSNNIQTQGSTIIGTGAPVLLAPSAPNLGMSADPNAGGETATTVTLFSNMSTQTKITLAVIAIIVLLALRR